MVIKTLVVDNNPVLLKAVSTLLEQEHCHVKTAGNGLEALEVLNEYHPDIVFTDLIMPLVGGEQLCKIIRKSPQLKDIFLVVLSAIILEDRKRILAGLDYDICIAKGSLSELRNHLQEALAMFTHKVRESKILLGDTVTGHAAESETGSVLGELLSEKYHLKEILENLHEGIIELSPQGKMVSLNRAAVTILDCEMENLIGIAFASLSWGDHLERVRTWLHDELNEKGSRSLEITEADPIRMKDRILSASFLPVWENGYFFAVCILRDITRQYTAEKYKHEFDNAIRLVKKMDSMSCMAGGMAHDFNNLLTVICGNLDMMTGVNSDMHENGILLESARKAAYLAVDLTRKISCFSPFGIISREDVIIEELIGATVQQFFRGNPDRYSCRIGMKKNWVNIDREQIAIAISNVLQNAIEAGATGEISISVVDETFDAPSIKAGQYVPAGNFVRISMEDNGKGIKSEDLLKVFDPYYSTKQRGAIKGMGLGLTIVYSTLRNHGGYVVVESEPGCGTVVSFFLPVYRSLTDRDMVDRKGGVRKRQILFMERDEQLRTIGKIMLEYLGYKTVIAMGKEEALQEVQGGIERNNPLAMVILNLSGSGGSDGVEICRALHESAPDLQVVVSSGSLLEPAMKNYKEYGFVNTLPKPYTLDDMKRITSIL
jgi:PAS domain S-box-containing protein